MRFHDGIMGGEGFEFILSSYKRQTCEAGNMPGHIYIVPLGCIDAGTYGRATQREFAEMRQRIMDGFEAMQQIRKIDKYIKLPVIALTAKAMKGDREKCLEAGASDYLAKAVNTEQLLSALRMWLHR